MKAYFLLIFVLIGLPIGVTNATLTGYNSRLNVTPSTTYINSTFAINLSFANVTTTTMGMEIKATDQDDKILSYQTFINGIWYHNGQAHNLSFATQTYNITWVFINQTNITTIWIYFGNTTQQEDRSNSIIALDDNFEGWQNGTSVLPYYFKAIGNGATVCIRGGKKGICAKGAAIGQHYEIHYNVTNTDGSTLNYEYGTINMTGNPNDIILYTYRDKSNSGGYRSPQESTTTVWSLRTAGDVAIGNATFTDTGILPTATPMNITVYRAYSDIGFTFRNATKAVITHISATNTDDLNQSVSEEQGSPTLFLIHLTYYNRTIDYNNWPPTLIYGQTELISNPCLPISPLWLLNLANNCTVTGTYSIGNILIYSTGFGSSRFINLNLTYSNLTYGSFINWATLVKDKNSILTRK